MCSTASWLDIPLEEVEIQHFGSADGQLGHDFSAGYLESLVMNFPWRVISTGISLKNKMKSLIEFAETVIWMEPKHTLRDFHSTFSRIGIDNKCKRMEELFSRTSAHQFDLIIERMRVEVPASVWVWFIRDHINLSESYQDFDNMVKTFVTKKDLSYRCQKFFREVLSPTYSSVKDLMAYYDGLPKP